MRSYRCPYCGRIAFNWFTKMNTHRHGHRYRTVELLYMRCKYCGKEAEFKTDPHHSKKYTLWAIISLLIMAFSVVLFLATNSPIVIVATLILYYPCCILLDYFHFKYDMFVRKGEYNDVLIPANLTFQKNYRFYNEVILILKPSDEDRLETSVASEYIVAVTERTEGGYNLRFIRPESGKPFTASRNTFFLFDEKKQIGTGQFIF